MESSSRERLVFIGLVTGLFFSSQAAFALSGAAPKGLSRLKIQKEWRGSYCGYTEPKRIVIKNADQWQEVWKKVHHRQLPTPALPEVGFKTKMAIAVFMGEQRSGGYAIEIRSITQGEQEIIAEIKETEPAPESLRTMVLTQPYHIVVVNSSELSVRFYSP